MSSPADAPYHLGRAERRGAVLGWRPGQALAAAVGATALVVGLGAGGSAAAVLGVLVALAAVAVAAVPVRGRGLDEWVPVAALHLARVRGGALCAGAVVHRGDDGLAHLRWPDGTATSAAQLDHRGLRALADEPRALGEALSGWLRGLGGVGQQVRSATILTVSGPGTLARHEAPLAPVGIATRSYVAISADAPLDVASTLRASGVDGAVRCDVDALDALLADRVAPALGAMLSIDVVARWHHLEGPASVHAAFLVEEWPAGDVDEQVLTPLCVAADRRTVALSLRVEELSRARGRTARVRTAAAADAAIAARGGFLASPEATRDTARDAERAQELAAGHGSLRLVGVVAIDAGDVLQLEAAAARLLADATTCGVRLRRCDGDHRRGVLATVPGWCVP
ncbi:MAG TPA: SCO6880 family protein [Acidimicrobiales bacterium]|jgi:hypothetical protein|nr:SCO6880 family protein [Acidimicrobiales bacterium]